MKKKIIGIMTLFMLPLIGVIFLVEGCDIAPAIEYSSPIDNASRLPTLSMVPALPIEMVWVDGGTFELGKEIGTANTGNAGYWHEVTLTGFHIGKFPVTQAQWQAVMTGNNNGISSNPSTIASNLAAGETQSGRPVDNVSWYDAVVFCNRLSIMEGRTPAYEMQIASDYDPDVYVWSTDPDDWEESPSYSHWGWNHIQIVANSNGYRLPTEAQWEYAAKGGRTSCRQGSPAEFQNRTQCAQLGIKTETNPDGFCCFTYAGSNDPDEVAWYGNNGGRTREVGRLKPNALGIHDMSGNVLEWCWDSARPYSEQNDIVDPMGPPRSEAFRMQRGGYWLLSAAYLRSIDRGAGNNGYGMPHPEDRSSGQGFRVVRP